MLVDLTHYSLKTFMAKTDKTLFSASEGKAHYSSRLNRKIYAINCSVTYTWVYQKVPRLSSTDRKQMALGEYLRYD